MRSAPARIPRRRVAFELAHSRSLLLLLLLMRLSMLARWVTWTMRRFEGNERTNEARRLDTHFFEAEK